MKLKLAPQEKQKLIEPIQDVFLIRVLGFEGALITDDSRISDFYSYPKERAIGKGSAPGTYRFKRRVYRGLRFNPMTDPESFKREHKNPANWVEEEFEQEPDPSFEEIIEKTRSVFGVDITPVITENLVEILLYIAENYKPKK